MDFDPAQISYQHLLDIFWQNHTPTQRSWSRQYRAAIFFHNDEQKDLALASRERLAARLGSQISTAIEAASRFYRAEDYHQKYRLRRERELMREFRELYPDDLAFVDSTAAARVNGYLAGEGSLARLEVELDSLGLSPSGRKRMLEIGKQLGRGTGLVC